MELEQLKRRQYDLLRLKEEKLRGQVGRARMGEIYVPYGRQGEFHSAGGIEYGGARERLFLAGNRCGKTLAGALEMVFHLTGQYPDWWQGVRFEVPISAWAASVTTAATRDILQATYFEWLPQHLIGRVTHKSGVAQAVDTVLVKHVSGEWSQLSFKSYDQGREKFQGTAREVIHLDEEPPIEIYEECLLRTMTTQGHILLTMTPLLGMTELCGRFLNTEGQNGRNVIRATWAEVPHLSKDEQVRMAQNLRPHEVAARRDGIPRLGHGKVFPIDEDELRVPRFEIPEHYRLVYGLDFGWSNPTAAILGAYDDDTDILYVCDLYYRAELPPAEHARGLHRFGEWVPGVCDPSGQSAGQADGQSLMQLYAQHGVYLTQADNRVESGIMAVLERMRSGKLKVFEDLEPWWREFRTYRRGQGGKIVKQDDHLMDATRYMVVSGLSLARTKPKQAPTRLRRGDWVTV